MTGVVFGGMSSIADSTSTGGETGTFQSAPTIVCAASSWFRSTIARYEVETTSRPMASNNSSAAANPAPGARLSLRPAR